MHILDLTCKNCGCDYVVESMLGCNFIQYNGKETVKKKKRFCKVFGR